MKQKRQAKIIEIIENNDIETQDELLALLLKEGVQTTQATISRDIREINLTKIAAPSGKQKYVLGKVANHESMESYRQVLSAGIISMEAAENIIVVKTVSGVAMAVAAALDNMEINGLVGSIAGDDTIFLAVRSKELTKSVINAIDNRCTAKR
ncbi:MAG: arginine repressor [Coprococcus sp.]|nr:arginine repressor [Coprococcus sp.]